LRKSVVRVYIDRPGTRKKQVRGATVPSQLWNGNLSVKTVAVWKNTVVIVPFLPLLLGIYIYIYIYIYVYVYVFVALAHDLYFRKGMNKVTSVVHI
jgi:hypothetical protein